MNKIEQFHLNPELYNPKKVCKSGREMLQVRAKLFKRENDGRPLTVEQLGELRSLADTDKADHAQLAQALDAVVKASKL